MKISKKSQYGLRALALLAKEKKEFLPLREISEKEEIPFDYLEKIFSEMEKKGLVKSKKGSRGGYKLARLPGKIKVGEIIRALEGKLVLVECIGIKNCSRQKTCPARGVWKTLQASLEKTINSITLKDINNG